MRKEPFRVALLGSPEVRSAALVSGFSPAVDVLPCRSWDELSRSAAAFAPELVVVLPGAPKAPNYPLTIPILSLLAEELVEPPSLLERRILTAPALRPSPRPQDRLLGNSEAMCRLRGQLTAAAPLNLPLLITGENGTGKDLAAQVAHTLSGRLADAFVPVNCGAVSPALAESEFFGSIKGAFTGAETRTGFCQQALGGSLFLDEIGELAPETQAKLLRVLESGEIRRVGSPRVEASNFRLICATNRNLAQEVKAGRFREDLYYRINVLTLRMPALRERSDDLGVLSDHFLDTEALNLGRPVGVSRQALGKMADYHWPGNLRQLRNVLFRAAIFHRPREILPEHLDWGLD